MAFVFVQQFGDGLVQGDRYRIDIDCGPGTAAHVTTQAATNIFGARENFATQLVNLRVRAGAVLEYLPDPVVPFRGVAVLPAHLPHRRSGRDGDHRRDPAARARRPRRAPRIRPLLGRDRGTTTGRTLLFADVLRLNPGRGESPRSAGVLGRFDVIATLYVISNQCEPAELVGLVRESSHRLPGGAGRSQ